MTSPSFDPHDPSDDLDVPAPVLDIDDTEPVPIEVGEDAEVADPPEQWATDLTDEDIDERFAGVDLTPDPEDGGQ